MIPVSAALAFCRRFRSFFGYDFVYISDTARLQYGTKSTGTVQHYARQITAKLLDYDISALVVACNTASAYAVDDTRDLAGNIPVLDMIDPAASGAARMTQTGHILVLGTAALIMGATWMLRRHANAPAYT